MEAVEVHSNAQFIQKFCKTVVHKMYLHLLSKIQNKVTPYGMLQAVILEAKWLSDSIYLTRQTMVSERRPKASLSYRGLIDRGPHWQALYKKLNIWKFICEHF